MAIDNKVVAKNIAALRMHAGMTQQQLAGALNVSHQAVSKWENGAAIPDIQTIQELAHMFGVSMEQLLSGEIACAESETLQGEVESNEPNSFGRWIREEIGEDTLGALRSAVDNARRRLQDFGDIAEKTVSSIGGFAEKTVSDLSGKAQEMFHRPTKGSTVDDEGSEDFYCGDLRTEEAQAAGGEAAEPTDEGAAAATGDDNNERADDAQSAAGAQIDFENILSMAPFMSREKLCEIVLKRTSISDWESVLKIAPFVNRPTVSALVEKCSDCPADRRVLKRLAPFAGAECLYGLICENLSAVDWDTLKSLAPYLQRSMVDALTEYMITGAPPVREIRAEKKKEGFGGAVQSAMDELGNAVNEIGRAVGAFFSSGKKEEANETQREKSGEQAPEAPDMPEAPADREPAPADGEKASASADMKNRVARAALFSENWSWINAHLFEITDRELLCEIAVKAVRCFAGEDNQAIAVRAAVVLSEEERARLFDAIIEERAWEVAVALKNLVNRETAGKIVKCAAEAEGAERENAYLAIEYFAKLAPKEILEEILADALKNKGEENWLLINAITDAS